MSLVYRITFRGEAREFTPEQCSALGLELVLQYRNGSLRDREKLIKDILDLVKGMFTAHYSFQDPNDRLDVYQEFRIAVLEAIQSFDSTKGASFQTYLFHRLKGAFNKWRYYQSETVRSKDTRFNRKTHTQSLDVENPNSAFPGQAGTQTYKDLIVQDTSEEDFKQDYPSLLAVLAKAEKILPAKKLLIFKAYIAADGNVTRTAEAVGFSDQYIRLEIPKLLRKVGKAFESPYL